MSNEYKDWLNDITKNQYRNYEMCMKYHFLLPRLPNGAIDQSTDYSYIGINIPDGWMDLFLQMCEDIAPLIEEYCLDFYFLQVKEKYGQMRCYPSIYNKEIDDIICQYEAASKYICCECGALAYFQTTDYILPYCGDCFKHMYADMIKYKTLTPARSEVLEQYAKKNKYKMF